MRATGSKEMKIWLADGTNYAGQDSIRARQDRLAESLQEIYQGLGDDERLVLEYKFFEPAFYHTDVPDWGTSLLHCLGPRREGRWSSLTQATMPPVRTSSSSSPSCCARTGSAPSTSTPATTPTTT